MKQQIARLGLMVIVCVAVLMTLMWISTWKRLSFDDPQIIYPSGVHQVVKLPFTATYVGKFTIRIKLVDAGSSGYTLRIYPDDELMAMRLNGRNLPLQLTTAEKRDYDHGFKIRINGLQAHADNILEFDLVNASNPAGFRIEPAVRLSAGQIGAIVVLLGFFGMFLSRYLRIDGLQKLCLVAGIILCVLYLSKTGPHLRTFDVYEGGGHRDYIQYLIHDHALPNPGDGWEYHQPPLYYFVAAITKVAAGISAVADDLWAQLLALYFWTIFLMAGLATLRVALRAYQAPLFLGSLALVWWPVGIIHSVRMGNDVPLYAFYTLAFYYLLRWWKQHGTGNLLWACIWTCAAVMTKSSGLAVAATLCTLWLLRAAISFRHAHRSVRSNHHWFKQGVMIFAFIAVALVGSFGENIYFFMHGATHDWLLSNVGQTINPGLRVGDGLNNFLIFDPATFLQHPFISTWTDEDGRQYFWNFFLRSSLSSEFSFDGMAMRWWGISNGIFLMCMLASMIVYALQRQAQLGTKKFLIIVYKYLPWVLSPLFACALLIAFRFKAPYSCNADFRYVYPVLLTWVCAAGLVLNRYRTLPVAALLAMGMPLICLNTVLWYALL